MPKSTHAPLPRKAAGRPKKPYPDFPLTPHPSGFWQKKIRGKIHYFGKWGRRVNGKLERVEGDGWQEALELYKAQADDLHAGRKPRGKSDGLTVAALCNHFLTAKLRQREAGELSVRSLGEYKQTTDMLVSASVRRGLWTTSRPTTSRRSEPRWPSAGGPFGSERRYRRSAQSSSTGTRPDC